MNWFDFSTVLNRLVWHLVDVVDHFELSTSSRLFIVVQVVPVLPCFFCLLFLVLFSFVPLFLFFIFPGLFSCVLLSFWLVAFLLSFCSGYPW